MGIFVTTLVLAGMHQRFIQEPVAGPAGVEIYPETEAFTGDLLLHPMLLPENKTREVSVGIDSLVKEKLQVLLSDSQTRPAPLPIPITRAYYKESAFQ